MVKSYHKHNKGDILLNMKKCKCLKFDILLNNGEYCQDIFSQQIIYTTVQTYKTLYIKTVKNIYSVSAIWTCIMYV